MSSPMTAMLSSLEFETLAAAVRETSGLVLAPEQSYLLESRLAPVARKWNHASVAKLAQHIRSQPHSAAMRDVTEAMTTNESFFFRDGKPFDLFRSTMLPAFLESRAATKRLRIWSAASSSGQEAYSLAMLLQDRAADLQGWAVDLVGTDISHEMVERSRSGLYSHFEVQRGLAPTLLTRHFRQVGDKWQASEALRRAVNFRQFNLLMDTNALGQFDIVFCRNVLIYFDLPTKARVLARIARQMPRDGYLVLGCAETVMGVTDKFRPAEGCHGVYTPA
jgi:chemotaxis protein methyltransferase CheR